MSLSTHVLDAMTGRPAVGVAVTLSDAEGRVLAERQTDADGRISDLAADLVPGTYRLDFATEDYFDVPTFYPEVRVTFRVTDAAAHLHVPLLLSPFAYSTYRGS
ncbi:hydroxyisourate hydrolase [Jatrophihabitans sp. YIM 134969]